MGRMETLEHAEALGRGLMDIGRASKASDVSVKMIRHYEAIGLLPKVARTLANYRLYSPNDVHLLRFIRRARALGFSMADIKELLSLWQNKSRSSASVKKIAGEHIQDLNVKIAELKSMVDTLEHLAKHCHGDHRPECPILDDLSHGDCRQRHHARYSRRHGCRVGNYALLGQPCVFPGRSRSRRLPGEPLADRAREGTCGGACPPCQVTIRFQNSREARPMRSCRTEKPSKHGVQSAHAS